MAYDEDEIKQQNTSNNVEKKKEVLVPACFYKNICCCGKGKQHTLCLLSHKCPFRSQLPPRKCLPVCTAEKEKPTLIETSCVKYVEEQTEATEVEQPLISTIDHHTCAKMEEEDYTDSIDDIIPLEKQIERICLAYKGPPKVTCTCAGAYCTVCIKREPLPAECDDIIVDCDCGLPNCVRCRTKQELLEQMQRKRCTCNLPECEECKWWAYCRECAPPSPIKTIYFYKRMHYMESKDLPPISEVKGECGAALAKLLFDYCPPSLKEQMGLTPPLTGAGDTLWQSPSDLLEGKVILKPPYSQKCIKALTHHGILEIGHEIEKKFYNEMEIEKQKELKKQKETLEYIAEIEKQEAIALARLEEQKLCEERMFELESLFEAKLKEELELLETTLKLQYEELLELQRVDLDEIWQAKLEAAVTEAVERLTAEFLIDLQRQEEELTKRFNEELQKEEIRFKLHVKNIQARFEEKLRQLKQELRCRNIANLMCMICVERRKCQAEKEALLEDYKQNLILEINREKDEKIAELEKEVQEKQKELDIREEYLLEIIRQYQKFVNFALKSAPTQAEFLLSVEKMLLFELTKAVAKINSKLVDKLHIWKDDSERGSSQKSEKMKARDYHECFHELNPPPKDTDPLPNFYYNDNLYIREDFRNLLSRGMTLTSSDDLWSRNVDDLINIMKGTIKRPSETSSSSEVRDILIPERSKPTMAKSSVHFHKILDDSQDFMPSTKSKKDILRIRKSSLKPTFTDGGPINYMALHRQTVQDSLIIGAVNSLELLKKKQPKVVEEVLCRDSVDYSVVGEFDQDYPQDLFVYKRSFPKGSSDVNLEIPSAMISKVSSKQKKSALPKSKSRMTKRVKGSTDYSHKVTIKSSLSTATDSLIIHRSSLTKKSAVDKRQSLKSDSVTLLKESVQIANMETVSKLSLARDSLEVIAQKQPSKEGVQDVDGIVNRVLNETPKCNASQEQIFKLELDDNTNRPIKVSRIEVIKLPEHKPSMISFKEPPHVIESDSSLSLGSPILVYSEGKKEKENFLEKPNEAKVVGDTGAKEYLQSSSEFTLTRASSLLKMFKNRPDLMKMFTACDK